MGDNLIPIVAVLIVGLCVIIPFYLHYQAKIKKMETLVKLAENGVDIKTGIQSLLSTGTSSDSDLRRGLIFIALSLPITLSLMIGGFIQEAAIFGGIPFCIGLAYLLMLKLGSQSKPSPEPRRLTSEDSF
jgi:hypothetical protein